MVVTAYNVALPLTPYYVCAPYPLHDIDYVGINYLLNAMHYCSVTNVVIRFLLLSPTVFVTAQVNSKRVAAASLGT